MAKMSVGWQEVAELRPNRLQLIDSKGGKMGVVAGLRRR